MPNSGKSSESVRARSPTRSCSAQRSLSQISIRENTPATTTSRVRPAYDRRLVGMATLPCRSGLISAAPLKNERAALRSFAPRFDSSRTWLATCSNSSGVNTERHPPLPFVTKPPAESWSRKRAGRITLPLASRECSNSPRNIRSASSGTPSCPAARSCPPPGHSASPLGHHFTPFRGTLHPLPPLFNPHPPDAGAAGAYGARRQMLGRRGPTARAAEFLQEAGARGQG